MRKIISGIILLLTVQVTVFGQVLKNSTDTLSYAIGMDIANMLKARQINVNQEVFVQAVKDVTEGKTILSMEESSAFLQDYFMAEQARQQEEAAKIATENKERGTAFLEMNKAGEGVVVLPSGLQYKIINEGAGEKPTVDDRVKVHYVGNTIDGNEFDSSVARGEPATFGLKQVIKGWTEILQLMPVGSKWRVFIPENLAYGPQGPPAIGPNQTLIFDIELLDIIK